MIMDRDLNRVVRAKPASERWVAALLMACGIIAIGLAAPRPVQAQLVLPQPGQNPQAIDFSADPLLGFLAHAAPPAEFRAAIAAAVARHPATGEADAGSDAALAARREARSALFPTFDASIVASRSLARDFTGNTAIVEGLVPRGRTDAAIGADQLLFDFGAAGGRIGGASARLRGARADADGSSAATALAAVEAWYQVLGYQAMTEISDALVERHRRILADTATRVAAGLGAGGDVARAEAGLADAIGATARQARTLASVRARYREVFGTEAPLRPLRPVRPQSAATDVPAAMAMSHVSPPVLAALAQAQAAHGDARGVRGDALPRLSAGVNAVRYNAFDSGSNYDVRGQVMLRQVFSAGGAEAARLAQANARARGADFAGERVIAEAERDAEAAFADARILDTSEAALADAYRANRRSRDIMAEQFRLSRGSLIDLLRTEQNYYAAAQALLMGSIERDLAHYTLMARTGELLGLFAIPVSAKD
jgi:adhesin transport system outer membrane protein